jgi:hypothetical protein
MIDLILAGASGRAGSERARAIAHRRDVFVRVHRGLDAALER